MMGGSCTQVWKTGDLGTRRTRKCPAHSRHNLTADTKKAPAEILVALVRLDLVKGFHTLVADFAATEGRLTGWMGERKMGNGDASCGKSLTFSECLKRKDILGEYSDVDTTLPSLCQLSKDRCSNI